MGIFEAWDEHNQRAADWENEIGRRKPYPKFGRTIGLSIGVMLALDLISRFLTHGVWPYVFTAALVVAMCASFGFAYRQTHRQRTEWEAGHRQAGSG